MAGFNILTVTQINSYLKSYIDENKKLSGIYIRGEITDFRGNYYSGHCYFTLKDDNSEISCVMFRSYAERLRFTPQDGMSVIARCDLSVYQKSCSCQLYVYDIQPDGLGAKYLAFEQLKERLSKEGLFDVEHKKSLPKYPEKIGVITSAQGAAVHDIMNVLSRRWPVAKLVLTPVAVQGEDAPKQLIEAVKKQDREVMPDLIIIGRGGGSSDDLSAFNDEELARAVYNCKTPIISAVGHETDFSICDFVADLRASTPSAAAELSAPDAAELMQTLDSNMEWLWNTIQRKIDILSAELDRINAVKFKNLTFKKADNYTEKLALYNEKLSASIQKCIDRKKLRFSEELMKLDHNSPSGTLKRSVCRAEKGGKTIKSAAELRVGDSFELFFVDGKIEAAVTDKTEGGISL